jgi:transposase
MDTAAFYAAYREDGHGRAAYEPAMVIALLLYCWSRGVRSARRIERACLEDVACRVIAAHQRPDHATIARFVVRHERALGELFGEVPVLCADAGLASVGVLAIDGTKVAANASRDRTMDYEQLAKAIIEEHIATDAAEDELHGEARGDELPPELATSKGRREWFREAKRRLDERRADEASPIPRSRPERLKDAKRRLDEELWTEQRANEAYEAYRARGVGRTGRRFSPGATPNPYTPPQIPEGKGQYHRPRRQAGQRHARLDPGLQRPGRLQRPAPDRRRRGHDRLTGLPATSARCSRPRAASSRPPASPRTPTSWSPTPATGIWIRSTRSPPTASRC